MAYPPKTKTGLLGGTSQYGASTGINPTTAAPTSPTAAPATAAPQTYTPDQYSQWAQTQFGQAPTQDDFQALSGVVGAPGTNGQYSQSQWDQAQQWGTQQATQRGWQPPATSPAAPAAPPSPFGNIPAPPPLPTMPNAPTPTPGQQAQVPTMPQVGQAQVDPLDPMAGQSEMQQQLADLIRQRMGQIPGDMQNDPIYKAQTDAYNLASQRGAERSRGQMAERAAAGGTLNSGGFNTALNGLNDQRTQGEAGFAANLAGQRLGEQQQQIQQAMQMAQAIGDQDLQRQLAERQQQLQQAGLSLQAQGLNQQGQLAQGQMGLQAQGMNQQQNQAQNQLLAQLFGQQSGNQLALAGLGQQGYQAQLQAMLQGRGLDLQGELGRGDLDLRRYLGQGQLGLGLMQQLFGNEQANNRLGFDYTQLQTNANRDAIMALLNGGAI